MINIGLTQNHGISVDTILIDGNVLFFNGVPIYFNFVEEYNND